MLKRIVSTLLGSTFISVSLLFLSLILFVVPAETEETRKSWTSVPHYTWTGNISGSPDTLSVTVNGNPMAADTGAISNYDGTVHIRIPLEHGVSNLISIQEGGQILFSTDIFYAYTFEAGKVPEGYLVNPFHTEQNEASCLACHRLKINMKDLIPSSPADSICYPCHEQDFSSLSYQHREAGINWECFRCHQTEAQETDDYWESPVKFTIQEGRKVAPLCYDCHQVKKKEHSEFNYVHGPVAMSGCNMCHNPHGSNIKRFLRKEISTMCVECHTMQDVMTNPVIHTPLAKEGCTACHDPHGNTAPFFLSADINELCFSCHKKIREKGNNHPLMGHPVSAPQDPLVEDREFTCVSCHNPHSSQYASLLAGEEIMMLCMNCHPHLNY
jgi:predicted CXXCH cytochrome family protein